jgi:hypothetical protein
MEAFLRRLSHILMVATWLGLAILVGMFYLPVGAAILAVGAILFIRALRRGFFKLPASVAEGAPVSERDAKIVVTQVLRNLIRIQVAYLCQKFPSRAESRSWLKHALPRAFHESLDEMHASLENARLGNTSPGVKLALQIVGLRERLLALEDSLARAHTRHPDHSVAHPVIYVVTEHINADNGGEPDVVMLASWNPSLPTLIPEVDQLAFFSEQEGGKQVRGQAGFRQALAALAGQISALDGQDSTIYAATPVEDPVRHGLSLEKIPLGFMIGTAELL